MKQNARTRNIILYILIALMVLTGALSGELRVQSELLSVRGSVEGAVYRITMGEPMSDEACTEEMIGTATRLPVIRAVRPLRRAFRALPLVVHTCIADRAACMGEFLRSGECQAQACAQGLVTTIQYIHDLDGKKSA